MVTGLILSSVIIFLYVFLIILFIIGWRKIKYYRSKDIYCNIAVSVIVAVRNESENISFLLNDLKLQKYAKEKLQIIIVNDHSEDNTESIVSENIKNSFNIKLVKLSEGKYGKKEAIIEGINHANGKLIITTDADCRVNKNWVATIAKFYQTKQVKMIISPVLMNDDVSFFQKVQSLEFMSLIGSGASAIGIGHPIMCNGANLAFEKSVFDETMLEKKYVSGDDVFLLHNIKKNYSNKILFLKNRDAIVYTNSMGSLKELLNQRIRWASKSKSYSDIDSIIVSLIIFLSNSILSIYLILAFADIIYLYCFFLFFLIKTIIDFLFFIPIVKFFDKTKLLTLVLPVQFFYTFYVTFMATIGIFTKYNWKGRKCR
ncbi:MAG: glycosyltransferase [Bacteroidota bacterium]|nr:glycosyltransferase [Bacteroidota bacterium]